jgi:hypothetical protein
MSENIGSSPADSVDYVPAWVKRGDVDAKAAKSNQDGISTPVQDAYKHYPLAGGAAAASAGSSEDSIAQDKGRTHSAKPNLSNRRA